MNIKSALVLIILFFSFSCEKNNTEKLDEKNKLNLTSSKWFGPIETEYFYYDKNNNEIENTIIGQRDTFTFDFNDNSKVLITFRPNSTYNGDWKLEDNKLLVTISTAEIEKQAGEFYLLGNGSDSEIGWTILDVEIKSITDSIMILESVYDSQDEEISYSKGLAKYSSME